MREINDTHDAEDKRETDADQGVLRAQVQADNAC
jgi:hypothetical protein